jgi:Virulence promoting factor.
VVSPGCHLDSGSVFYNVMNKKPIAQASIQHTLLEHKAVYGLLSQSFIAIVVNCFTLSTTFEVRYV